MAFVGMKPINGITWSTMLEQANTFPYLGCNILYGEKGMHNPKS
jgi:hypothetical protein